MSAVQRVVEILRIAAENRNVDPIDHRLLAESILKADPALERDLTKTPKADGWHTYHVCAGRLREITWSGRIALCPECGQMFETKFYIGLLVETGPSTLREHVGQRLMEARDTTPQREEDTP